MKLIFATNNPHKVSEIQLQLPIGYQVLSLKQAGILVDIDEPYDTIEANASEKSRFIEALTHQPCFSEDSGLETAALQGAPGVKSARFAGNQASSDDNIRLLLQKMKQAENRKARFKTVISLRLQGAEHLFTGICTGSITQEPKGSNGFGYDPVFVPDGSDKTFAQMLPQEKLQFSHRAKAVNQLLDFLTYIQF